MNFNSDEFNWSRCHVWNFIVGVQYVTVGSTERALGDVLFELKEAMGEEFKAPCVLVSCSQINETDFDVYVDLELLNYQFGV